MAARHFFIFGLPRTRTAWMSVWFTNGASTCVHDALRGGPEVEAIRRAETGETLYFGTADSMTTAVLPIVMGTYPKANLMFVRRPVEEVYDSLARAGVPRARESMCLLRRASDQCEEALALYPERVMALDFHAIDMEAMRRAQEWLTPLARFDESRWRRLDQLNITVDLKKYGFVEDMTCPR